MATGLGGVAPVLAQEAPKATSADALPIQAPSFGALSGRNGEASDEAEAAYGEALAAYRLGDYALATSAASRAAAGEHGEALKLLGVLHISGLAPAASDETGAGFLRRAFAASADPDVAVQLGLLAIERRGGVTGAEAGSVLRDAMEAGSIAASRSLARLYLVGADGVDADPARGLTLMRQAAGLGDVEAQRDLGVLLVEGRAGAPDLEEGLDWLRRAAEAGDTQAAYETGLLYADGTAIAANDAEAAKWFERASAGGHGRAAALRGVLSLIGSGAPKSAPDAVRWFSTAADKGDPLGRYYLALSKAKGEGVARDLEDAYRLVILSEGAGPLDDAQETTDRARLRAALEATLPPDAQARLMAEAGQAAGSRLRR